LLLFGAHVLETHVKLKTKWKYDGKMSQEDCIVENLYSVLLFKTIEII